MRSNGLFTPEQDNDNDKKVEPMHSYDAFYIRSGNNKTNMAQQYRQYRICKTFLVIVLLYCELKTP